VSTGVEQAINHLKRPPILCVVTVVCACNVPVACAVLSTVTKPRWKHHSGLSGAYLSRVSRILEIRFAYRRKSPSPHGPTRHFAGSVSIDLNHSNHWRKPIESSGNQRRDRKSPTRSQCNRCACRKTGRSIANNELQLKSQMCVSSLPILVKWCWRSCLGPGSCSVIF